MAKTEQKSNIREMVPGEFFLKDKQLSSKDFQLYRYVRKTSRGNLFFIRNKS